MNLSQTSSPVKNKTNGAAAFWEWFAAHEYQVHGPGNQSRKIEAFLTELIPQLKKFNPWLKALVGPCGAHRFELVITSDADIALFPKAEELIDAAPTLSGWIFTALKPALGLDKIRIEMYGCEFSDAVMQFYPVEDPKFPDKIRIVFVHRDYDRRREDDFRTGAFVLVENGIGELAAATKIDEYQVRGLPEPKEKIELIPLGKLEEYLNWREKEFVEKYVHVGNEHPPHQWGVVEGKTPEGQVIFAAVNRGYRHWEYKPAYPWLGQLEIRYRGDLRGLPVPAQFRELEDIEKEVLALLPPGQIIHVGHSTFCHCRTVYLFTSDYRLIANPVMDYVEGKKTSFQLEFFIRKDKYWECLGDFT
jgi:hypothetical protein